MTNQKELIEKFLGFRRIAVAGVSRNPKDFSRAVWKEFRSRGIDAIPVHPSQTAVGDVRCYAAVRDISPRVEGVLSMVSAGSVREVLNDCAMAGVPLVWLYGIRGEKDVPPDALKFCSAKGIEVIAGHCPLMFLPHTAFFHSIHGAVWKLVGLYPR